ncbi:MAG TPA: alpha-amylase family glycosyl hydrolase [Dinghuibacter sp.]|uniref:alpha-amylase family glycosyl hydrolase n=1 Tax=Dinghuibacter sp. TaxID=2024697 RepID=UPI002CA3AC51|nr:alpha-amylase family glycosyl hydrolase [Dinghuibacter sp.]HTJ12794.1 alpha-amylase family glycosyl hydrolase [Dinghuibacter sp.]
MVRRTICTMAMICFLWGGARAQEVIYHVFERSFYDANGDGHGDLQGLKAQLGYLQRFGVTSILLTPLYASAFYHNYFADSWEAIDPGYGTMRDYLDLVEEIHRRGMKIYLDMETQYITDRHPWWGSAHVLPGPIIWGITELKGYDGATRRVATVNLRDTAVLAYNERLFGFFADPNGDGRFDDGVDGFRLDHTMDDLDGNPRLTGLFTHFWAPLLAHLRQVNDQLTFVAEQADWSSFGFDYFTVATLDRVFAFRLALAIASFDKKQLTAAADTTLGMLPDGKQQVVFLENHDIDRFASRVGGDPRKERVGAVFNLMLGGVPSIYYGQELGMKGSGGFNKFGNTDANDIPRREAYEWYAADTGRGMALWYKGTGPWWDSTNVKPFDGISLEEEMGSPASLWGWYRDLLVIRKANPALYKGAYVKAANSNPQVFSWMRYTTSPVPQRMLLVVNLSAENQAARLDSPLAGARRIFGSAVLQGDTVLLQPYAMGIFFVH